MKLFIHKNKHDFAYHWGLKPKNYQGNIKIMKQDLKGDWDTSYMDIPIIDDLLKFLKQVKENPPKGKRVNILRSETYDAWSKFCRSSWTITEWLIDQSADDDFEEEHFGTLW